MEFPVSDNSIVCFLAHLYEQKYAAISTVSAVSTISFVHTLIGMVDPGHSFNIKKSCKKVKRQATVQTVAF